MNKKNETKPMNENRKNNSSGYMLTWVCKKCKTENKKNSMYCRDCGDYK